MSKFYTLMLAISTLFFVQAQNCDTVFYDNGEGAPTNGVSLYPIDFDTLDVSASALGSAQKHSWGTFYEATAPDTNIAYLAFSWFTTPGQANNWLVYDGILAPENGGTLSWKHKTLSNMYRDGYLIIVESDNAMDTVFQVTDDDPSTDGDSVLVEQSVDLDADMFGGDSINIYIIHNANDMFGIFIDDVALVSCESDEPTDTTVTDTTIIDDTTSNSDTVIIVDTVTNTDTVVVVEGDTVYTTIYDTIIITETIEVPGDDITATIVIDIEGTCNDISTGITEGDFTANELTAYPNPVLDVLNIQINNTSSISGSFTLNIYAIDGSLVKTETISSTATVDLSSLEAGFHVIEVIGANEVLAHQKFLKN
jgi:hypothetical protein